MNEDGLGIVPRSGVGGGMSFISPGVESNTTKYSF